MSNFNKRILIIDFCNYEDYQIGGHLTFARNLLSALRSSLDLVGITTDKNDPIGRWFKKSIDGVTYDFFALKRSNKLKEKNIIPDRLVSYILIRYYRKKILQKGSRNVFVQRHEILPAIRNFNFENICYRFPGLENPLRISRYWYGKFLAKQFDRLFFNSLKEAKLILAAGDDKAIDEMVQRSKQVIFKNKVIKFPTRIDTNIFKPLDKHIVRKQLKISDNDFIISSTGRLAWFKGWKFMIDSFILFERIVPDSYFYIIGTGEDLPKIQEYLSAVNISEKVILTGGKTANEISLYLNASDLFIMGSFKEGWSTSLSESIACGIPSCVTNFSSAKEIIIEGVNGFVSEDHDEEIFVQAMLKAMKIPRPVYSEHIKKYSTNTLKEGLLNIWELI